MSALRKSQSTEIGAEGGGTKFVELGGKLVTSGLSGSMNFTGNQGCHFSKKCNIDPEADCRIPKSVYEVECYTCRADPNTPETTVYVGTSGFCLHKRQVEHVNAVRGRHNNNALAKHRQIKHRDTEVEFRSKVLRGGIK